MWLLGVLIIDEVIVMGVVVLLFFILVDKKGSVFVFDWYCLKKMLWDVLIFFGGGLSFVGVMEKIGLVVVFVFGLGGMVGWLLLSIVFLVMLVMIFVIVFMSNIVIVMVFLFVIGVMVIGVD